MSMMHFTVRPVHTLWEDAIAVSAGAAIYMTVHVRSEGLVTLIVNVDCVDTSLNQQFCVAVCASDLDTKETLSQLQILSLPYQLSPLTYTLITEN